MESKHFHHALKINGTICIGCSHCMNVCPTEAIRVRSGKAVIFENRCVDCGECFKACPVNAIFIDQDDFEKIHNYTYRVALVPAVFFGQFPKDISSAKVNNAILDAGFTHIYPVELSTGLLCDEMAQYIHHHTVARPLISSFCPAIIRLIQVRFPELTSHIILLKPPLDITSLYIRKKLADEGISPGEIGVFYITPCAAKIAAIKSPVGEDFSMITGVINMDYLFNKVCKLIYEPSDIQHADTPVPVLQEFQKQWTLTGGEANRIPGRSLAIDGIHHVIEFLENIENEELKGIDFLELRACDESCAGGVLVSANRFLVTERLRKNQTESNAEEHPGSDIVMQYKDYLKRRMGIQAIKPRSMMILDENMDTAMNMMDKEIEINKLLPEVDCGICGSPNCRALANDVVRGLADIRQCIFIRHNREKTGELSPELSREFLKNIWGEDKF